MSTEATEGTVEERLAAARKAKADRDTKAEATRQLHELKELELEEQYTLAGGGRGVDFEIVATPGGPIVLKLGKSVLFKRLQASKINFPDVFQFAIDQVDYPEREEATAIFDKYRGAVTRCSDALVALHRGEAQSAQGKF